MQMMKAAVLHGLGQTPVFGELPVPQIADPQQVILKMQAASIKQLDRLKAAGKHYTGYATFPAAVGVDGVGFLPDGQRVYAMGITGMLAEYALVRRENCVPVPDALSAPLAALLPNALLGSDAALLSRGQMQSGQVVLINGATGVSGRMAVQAARMRGAGRIIATGRNPESLAYIRTLGADVSISLLDDERDILQQLEQVQRETPIDLVLDYLWGKPMGWLLQTFARHCPQPVRIVTIGQMAGATLELASSVLRSRPISLVGSGLGSITNQQLKDYASQVLPQLFLKAIEGQLQADYRLFSLQDVESAWCMEMEPGARAVVLI